MIADISPFTYTPGAMDWFRIWPEVILLVAGLLILLADLVTPPGRKGWLALVGLAGVVGALASTVMLWAGGMNGDAFYGMVNDDHLALFANVVILFAVGIGLLFSPGYIERQGIVHEGEYYTLMILAALGMMLMSAASNLMIIFVGLEILSLALYILSAIVTTRRRSQEAGMKYFILSSFASAFLLYGMALLYGATGSTNLTAIRAFLASHHNSPLGSGFGPLLLVALGLMAVGFCFKVSAIPFQAWTPDVYVGAPTSVTAFMSVGTKVAAFAGLVRVFFFALPSLRPEWEPVFWAVAVLTMIGGNLMAASQRDVKRMLAYSSVANGGYMMVAIATHTQASLQGLLIYLACYAVMNVGAFGVVLALERRDGQGTTLDDFAGLGRRNPALAALMALFMFSLAGTPATAGFIGKWYVFYAAMRGAHVELAIIGVLASLIGVYYYLRVVWAMYFTEPATAPLVVLADEASPGADSQRRHWLHWRGRPRRACYRHERCPRDQGVASRPRAGSYSHLGGSGAGGYSNAGAGYRADAGGGLGAHGGADDHQMTDQALTRAQQTAASQPGRGALVIGASSGIGAALARELARRGYTLALVARRADRLGSLRDEINRTAGRDSARVYVHDVRDYDAVPDLLRQIVTDLGANTLQMVVYTAGIMPDSATGVWPFADERAMLETNTIGAIRWLGLAADIMLAQGRGTLVGVSSVAGERGRRGNSAYQASKAALTTWLESLRYRLKGSGVRVVTAKPGYVATEMTAGLKLPQRATISADEAARRIVSAAERGRAVAYVPGYWRPIMWTVRQLPAFLMTRLPV